MDVTAAIEQHQVRMHVANSPRTRQTELIREFSLGTVSPLTRPSPLKRPSQDEMIELQEREEQAAAEEKLSTDRAAHNALMKEANLDGVETLVDDMVCEG